MLVYTCLFVFITICNSQYLSIDKSDRSFTYAGNKVFLSGVNQAWINYGQDFGNNQPNSIHCAQRDTLVQMQKSGGHAIRYWLFVEGAGIPQFDSNGFVLGTDAANTLITDVQKYLREAQDKGVLVFFCLWNAAVMNNQKEKDLFWDNNKLQSFIDKALIPLVTAVKNETAVGGWEIINEPEGGLQITNDNNDCFNTQRLSGSGAGWSGGQIPMKNFQQFINWQADAIKSVDPKALVTVGSWSERAITDKFGYYNYYKDDCLLAAGGRSLGTLDFYEVHSYAFNNQFSQYSPFKLSRDDYGLDKPLVVGEFEYDSSGGLSPAQMYSYVYNHGYNGAWGWTAEPKYRNFEGMNAIKSNPNVNFTLPPPKPPVSNSCDCSDVAPDSTYTCQQQASWGKCGEAWMKGFCCKSCFNCVGCSK